MFFFILFLFIETKKSGKSSWCGGGENCELACMNFEKFTRKKRARVHSAGVWWSYVVSWLYNTYYRFQNVCRLPLKNSIIPREKWIIPQEKGKIPFLHTYVQIVLTSLFCLCDQQHITSFTLIKVKSSYHDLHSNNPSTAANSFKSIKSSSIW